ncbi:MAG: hypothetical protein AB7S26_23590 [Sandaracinaceae bacterium]
MNARSAIGTLAAAAALSGCMANAGGAVGELSENERERLESLGIYAVEPGETNIAMLDADGVAIGTVEMLANGGFAVSLDGFEASLEYTSEEFSWQCQDGHAATGPARGPGLLTMIGYDETMTDGECARALAAGWLVNGVFKEPPSGCERVVIDGVARLECELPDVVGGEGNALLSQCDDGGGGGGWGGWGDGCTNTGTGCAPECGSCSYASGAALCSGGGGGGGGGDPGEGYCSRYDVQRTGYAFLNVSVPAGQPHGVTAATLCATAYSNAEACPASGWICRLRESQGTQDFSCSRAGSTIPGQDYYQCSCSTVKYCSYSRNY